MTPHHDSDAVLAAAPSGPAGAGEPTLLAFFGECVRVRPEATALLMGERRLTYSELDGRANAVARRLRSAGIGPEDRVGVLCPRSFEMVAALLGALKARAAWVPLDPSYPEARLAFMLEDSGARALLRAGDVPTLPFDGPALDLDTASEPDPGPAAEGGPGSAIYVLYTSGSTGRPKGVVGLQGATTNRLEWMWNAFPFQAGEVCCQKTVLGFVDAVSEIFLPLLSGVPLVLVSDADSQDPRRLVVEMGRTRVTRLVVVPSLLEALLERDLGRRVPTLRLVVSSGETLRADLARRFQAACPKARLLNLYGSSEVAGDATWFDTAALAPEAERVPIGRPIANTRVLVMDEQGQPVAAGQPGELWVGGAALARGYLDRPELTAARFVTQEAPPGGRLFRTGDRGRLLPDGNLEFLGRLDHQVKLRGVRIELGEVEAALVAHPGVDEAVTLLREVAPGDVRLVAYVENAPGRPVSHAQLWIHVRAQLPAAMVPADIVTLQKLPRLPNGKVDRQALQVAPLDARAEPRAEQASTPGAPRTVLERKLVGVWADCLGIADLGIHDDFFESGGHSLLAVDLLDRVELLVGREVPLAWLLQSPTIAGLAGRLEGAEPSRPGLVVVQDGGPRRPVFFVPSGRGAFLRLEVNLTGLRRLAQALGPDQPLFSFCLESRDPGDLQRLGFRELAYRFLNIVREVQPEGPYRLAGYSFGGRLAYQMASQLRAEGSHVELLALLDTYGPGYPEEPGLLSWRRWKPWPGRLWRFARRVLRMPGGERAALVVDRLRGSRVHAEGYPDLAALLARSGHVPRYPGPLTLLRSRLSGIDGDGRCWDDPRNGWWRVCDDIRVVPLDVAHETMLSEDAMADVGPMLAELLEATTRSSARAASLIC